MAKKKVSMSAKIRNLLDKKVEPLKIAKQLKIAPAYVHTIKWAYNNKGKKSKKVKARPSPSGPMQTQFEMFPLVTQPVNTLDAVVRKRIEDIVTARVNAVLESM
jgi:hypothetical protein